MALQNRIYNPTPFDVVINWHQGVDITVPADGYYDLDDIRMLNDFHEGQPGSENVKEMLAFKGVFVRDPSRDFNVQALEALEKIIRAKKEIYNAGVTNLRSKMAGANMSDTAVFDEHLQLNGYAQLNDRIQQLEKRRDMYRKEVVDQGEAGTEEQLDPKRTLLFHTPPKVFETELQMKVYLSEHPDEAKRHGEFMKAWEGADGASN